MLPALYPMSLYTQLPYLKFQPTESIIWLGIHRRHGNGTNPLTDFWYVGENINLVYHNFKATQPDAGAQNVGSNNPENCVVIYWKQNYQWFDAACGGRYKILCEF